MGNHRAAEAQSVPTANEHAAGFTQQGLRCTRQVGVPVKYRGEWIGEYRIDMIVEDAVLLEIKSTEREDKFFEAQTLAYLRASGLHVGLIINFNSKLLSQGVKRLVM